MKGELEMVKRILQLTLGAVIVVSFNSCNINKKSKEDKLKAIAPKEIVASYNNTTLTPEFLSADLRISLKNSNSKNSFSAKIRVQKDKKIWVNVSFLGISVARALLTPDSLQMYERQNDTYFAGSFEFVSKIFGADLNFYQIQSLIFGQTLYNINPKDYQTLLTNSSYLLEYSNNRKLTSAGHNNGDFIKRYWLNPDSFVLEKQLIAMPDRSNTLIVENKNFEQLDGKYKLPSTINLQIIGESVTLVEVDIDRKKTDSIDSFPFKIPSGFKQLQLK